MQKRSERACIWAHVAAALVTMALAALPLRATAQMATTTVQGTVYRADGTPAGGTLLISWPAFTTAQNQAVAAGSLNATIGANGFVSVNLTPNAGGLPSGSYYTATYHLNDGTVSQDFWVVPASGTATVAAVRAQLQPATMAVPQAASATYVQNAIASLSGTYLPLTGGTMAGALTLSGDPTGSSQAATKHYADQLAAQNLPLSGGSLSGTLTAPGLFGKNVEGGLFADQWMTNGANNGIAMSLEQCVSLPYACQVLAPVLYAQVEAQPFGTAWGDMYPPQTTGPKASDPVAEFQDHRWGVPQYIFNGSRTFDARHGAWPSYVMNFIGSSALNGTFGHPAGALEILSNWWAGGRNFYNDKTNAETLNITENHYTQIQGGGTVGVGVNCFGNGDCLGPSVTTVSYGGPNTAGDEANENDDDKNTEGASVFAGIAASVATAADGATTLTTSNQTAAGTQGEGRLLIDVAKDYNTGYVSNIAPSGGNLQVTCATCNWDATFGTSTETTLSAAVQNPVSGTNSFPQTSVTLQVGSSAGFAAGDLAGIFDYDYECEKVTAVPDGTHITIATDQLPHPVGAMVTRGGLTCRALEFEADRLYPSNTNGVSTMPGFNPQQTIRNAIPILYSASGNKAYLFGGYNQLPGQGNIPTTRAYAQMAGSGGTCTPTVSGGVLTGISVSGGTGYISTQYPPQIVFSGTWSSAPSAYITGVSGGAVTAAAVLAGGSGLSGVTCSIAAQNPYDIYPAAKTLSVYDAGAGAVNGKFVTEPWPVTPAVNDALEQPHYFLQHVMGDLKLAAQYIPTVSGASRTAYSYACLGIFAGSDQCLAWGGGSDPSLYSGYPSVPNILGRGQLLTGPFSSISGPWRQYFNIATPPFAPGQSPTDPGGYYPSVFGVGCGNIPCSSWVNAYWLFGAGTASGVAGLQVTPATGTLTEVSPGTANTACSTALTGSSTGGFAVTCSGHTSKFDAAGNLALAGAVNAPGGVSGAKINGEVTVDGTTYATVNAAWSAAVGQANSTGQNQTVRLGPGTYPVSATLTEPANGACVNLTGSSGTTMNADSGQVATTLTVPNALNGDVFFLGNATQAQGCTFKDFNVLAAGHATHGFELQWFRGLLIDNVTVNDTSADGVVLGEEDTSAGHQASFLIRNVTVSYSAGTFTPANRPAYGVHLEKTAMDSELDAVTVRNALTAAVYNEGTGNTGYLVHGFGYPYTCTTAPCANNASSGSAANASYATNYVIYDVGGGGSVWTDTYVDSPATAGFYVGANGVEIHGGHIQWPEVTSFPGANLAYVAAGVSNNLLIADLDCLAMAPGVNWITYGGASGNPPTYASVHHLTGCGNYYQALEPANTTGFSSGGANINDPSGAVPRVWSTPVASAASYPAYSAQMYTGYQGDAFQAHFSGVNPFFNVTYQGTIRTNGGIALSTVTNTASSLTLTAANKNVIANASSGPQTITLPSCYTPLPDRAAPTGLEFTIIKSDTSSNAVTVATSSSQLIYTQGVGASTLVLSGPSTQTLVCGPDYNWYVAGSTAASASTPHMTWGGSFAGTFGTSLNTSLGAIWTPSAGINVARLDVAVGTAPSGCATWPVIGVYDSTAATWLKTVTLASGTYSYRNAVSGVAVPAGHNLSMGVQTAGAGCSTNAGSAQLTMEYTMQ